MSYWYEVIAPVQDGPDDVTWDKLATFNSMILAIEYARRHEDSKCLMILDQDGVLDTVELPLKLV